MFSISSSDCFTYIKVYNFTDVSKVLTSILTNLSLYNQRALESSLCGVDPSRDFPSTGCPHGRRDSFRTG